MKLSQYICGGNVFLVSLKAAHGQQPRFDYHQNLKTRTRNYLEQPQDSKVNRELPARGVSDYFWHGLADSKDG